MYVYREFPKHDYCTIVVVYDHEGYEREREVAMLQGEEYHYLKGELEEAASLPYPSPSGVFQTYEDCEQMILAQYDENDEDPE